MDQFEDIGCKKFYMSVNYKANMMEYYLSQLDHKYDIEFFMEDKPLGTIGSVALLKGKITTPFFVSNCDSINDQDYRDVYDYHVQNKNDLTIVTMVKSFKIPYGVIETGEDGLMTNLREKPELNYQVNTGAYILNPECIDEIPEGEFFHITHLMEKIKVRGGRQDRVALQNCVLTPVAPDQALIDDNPLSKIPALRLPDGNVIHDSRVILDYLDHQHVGNPLIPRDGSARWRRLTLASMADGIMDAAVLVRHESGPACPGKTLG